MSTSRQVIYVVKVETMVAPTELEPISEAITDKEARKSYEQLRENIIDRDQIAATSTLYELLQQGRSKVEILSETVRTHAPYTHVPYHQKIDQGIVRFVNNDHCLLSGGATLRLEGYMSKHFEHLPLAQTVWYVPTGLDIWNQLKGKMPGHYGRRVYDASKYPEGPLDPEVHWNDEQPKPIEGTFEEGVADWFQLVERGDVPNSYRQWLGLWEDTGRRKDLLANTVFAGLMDVQDRIMYNRSFTTGHKSFRARAAIELGNRIGWDNAHHVIYASIPDIAVGPRWYSAYEAAGQIMLNQLEEEAPTSSLAATQSTNTDRRLFAQELPLSPIEEETLIRSILREEEAAYFEAITILLKAGRSPKAILDAIQIASARVVLAIADPPAYSMPQHGFEYTNTLAWFYANFEHEHKTKLLYVAANFINQCARLIRDMPDYNYQSHQTSRFSKVLQARSFRLPEGVDQMSARQLLHKIDESMMVLNQDASVAYVQAYLEAGHERESLIAILAMGAVKQGNDPHNQEIGLCMIEDYKRSSSSFRDELLMASARHTAGHQKYGDSLELYRRYSDSLGIEIQNSQQNGAASNEEIIESFVDDIDLYLEPHSGGAPVAVD